jgi:hypothetical protein
MEQAGFSWNYTTWLNLIAIVVGGWLIYLHLRHQGGARHDHDEHEHAGHHAHHH